MPRALMLAARAFSAECCSFDCIQLKERPLRLPVVSVLIAVGSTLGLSSRSHFLDTHAGSALS